MKSLLAIDIYVSKRNQPGYVPNTYIDLDYIAISKELLPVPLSDKIKSYATPNPFYPQRGQTTTFQLNLADLTEIYTIQIFNLKGQLIRRLDHQNVWDGNSDVGVLCEGGVYLYQLEKNGQRSTGQIVLVR
jgi:hypothetical protein